MYAVIRTGGKQYRVAEGDVLRVEKLPGEPGATVEFDEVLMVGEGKDVTIGQPLVSGTTVKATIRAAVRGDKVEIIKFKRRKHHMKRQGHRQDYTEVEITGIGGGKGGSSAKAKPAESADKPAAKKATTTAKKPAASKAGSDKKPAAKKSASTAKKSASTTKKAAPAKKATTAKKASTAKKPAAKKASKDSDK